MAGAHSRNKGNNFEREVANTLKPLFPLARRGLGQARSGGESPDVDGTPYWIQTKRQKKQPNIKAAIAQGERDLSTTALNDSRPVLVITKEDQESAIASMRFASFLDMLREFLRLKALVLEQQRAIEQLEGKQQLTLPAAGGTK